MNKPSSPLTSPQAVTERGGYRPPKLSEELMRLIGLFAERSVTLREVMEALHGRAFALLLILLALPFCTPIPLPGLSTPFGLVIALIGFRLSLRQKPWLPARLLDTVLPPRFFGKLLSAGRRIIRGLEWGLLLPLPIPFSNFLPALVVVLTSAALLERDGYCAIAGGVVFLVTLCFFAALAWGGAEGIGWGSDWLGRWFGGD